MEGGTNVAKSSYNSFRSELRSMMRPSLGSTSSLSLSTHRRQPSTSSVQSPPVPRRPPLSSTSSTTSTNGSDLVHQGWLTKSPPPRGIFKPKWRKRWFILKAGLYPNQFVLEYFTDSTCRRQKGHINLDECEQIQGGPLSAQDRHKFTFNLRTPSRTYYLASDSEAEMTKWVSCLCQVCGIKNTETETEIYKPSDENNQPTEVEEQQENLVSDESSPTLSSVSSAYIPISECFTGKPILFNDKAYEKERIYCNTSSTLFPFPPKVNWATHPGKKESSSDNSAVATTSPTSVLVNNSCAAAPPRPPKKPGSATVPDIAITIPEAEALETSNSEKTQNTPSADHTSVFSYDDCVGDNQDSSSTSSLQSPPGSAGALYCNISGNVDTKAECSPSGPIYQNPSAMLPPKSQSSQANPIPSPGVSETVAKPPPKVNRKLKPEVNKPLLSPAPNKFQAHKHSSGAMTLPNRNNFRQLSVSVGPAIDRSRKPPESPIMLGPTPAQVKNQASSSLRHPSQVGNTSTLPASPRRRVGPTVSPHGHDQRLPVYHEYDQPEDLIGTYTQIDCKSIAKAAKDNGLGGEATNSHHSKVNFHKKGTQVQNEEGSVEYRLIDHVKTEALNKMRQEREEQLVRTNPISLKSFS